MCHIGYRVCHIAYTHTCGCACVGCVDAVKCQPDPFAAAACTAAAAGVSRLDLAGMLCAAWPLQVSDDAAAHAVTPRAKPHTEVTHQGVAAAAAATTVGERRQQRLFKQLSIALLLYNEAP